jgi:hypothetical protein
LWSIAYTDDPQYKVYMCDLVPRTEHFRVSLHEAQEICQKLMGKMSGFNMPEFTMDLPGGGGKRNLFMHDEYNPSTGISKWRAPEVKPGQEFLYYDPDPHAIPLKDTLTDAQLQYWSFSQVREEAEPAKAASHMSAANPVGQSAYHGHQAATVAVTTDAARSENGAQSRAKVTQDGSLLVTLDNSYPSQQSAMRAARSI